MWTGVSHLQNVLSDHSAHPLSSMSSHLHLEGMGMVWRTDEGQVAGLPPELLIPRVWGQVPLLEFPKDSPM